MQHGPDVVQELTADHRVVEDLFAQLEALEPGRSERRQLLDAVTIELVRHSVAEEMHLYPVVREHLEHGDSLADTAIAEHERIEELLKDLEGRHAGDRDFDRLVRELRTELAAHVEDQESGLFPRLHDGVHPYVLELLGRKIRETKRSGPARPPSHASGTPPANKLLAPGLGLVDRVRDYVSGRGE
ncbi:hemerythrin domain-containing protein [Streptomyces sp. NPDC048595]|uniref:hemerythrin domain-containing protein n=1 Tax=Streptomyces sp. NPDC048595 TaxID=3365576 RepID=UPI0037167711